MHRSMRKKSLRQYNLTRLTQIEENECQSNKRLFMNA